MRRLVRVGLLLLLACIGTVQAQQKQDTIVVARDGTGEYRTIQEAVEAVRAFYGLHRYYIYKGWDL